MNSLLSPELLCCVSLESLCPNGTSLNRVTHRDSCLMLLRNEFRDIILKITAKKLQRRYVMHNYTLHQRFVKEGKATITFSESNVRIMLSNCPPNKLQMFLKVLSAKVESLKENGVVSHKARLNSNKVAELNEISPLTEKDINALRAASSKTKNPLNATSPSSTGGKRKTHPGPGTSTTPTQKKLCIQRIIEPTVKLTTEQKCVLSAVLSGKNVFFTGSAGTGKSYLLKRILSVLPPESTFATASTGIAACQIGGLTLHSFAGIGSGSASLEQCIQQAQRKTAVQQWKKCQHLIIDEISMVDGQYFNILEKVARAVRNSDKPFGGIQLIISGDFLQLPPVSKSNERSLFCFQSAAWRKCIEVNIELTQVMRQKEPKFINMLQQIRLGRCSDPVKRMLESTSLHQLDQGGILATRLCTHKDDVEYINTSQLNKLAGDVKFFSAADSDKELAKFMDKHCPVLEKIELKVGAQVMLTKNIGTQRGLVNGARGVVTSFDSQNNNLPVVKFVCGVEQTVFPERWTMRVSGGVQLTRKQIPLKLAWALSIHKSQGMSLDCVEISLSRVFESGQAYVALSRAKSFKGLRVIDFTSSCVRANPDALSFYLNIQKQCRERIIL